MWRRADTTWRGSASWRFRPAEAARLPARRPAQAQAESNARDYVDLDERVSGNTTGRGNGSAYWRLGPEAAEKRFVHARIILQIVEIDIALQDFVHRRPDALELLLDR